MKQADETGDFKTLRTLAVEKLAAKPNDHLALSMMGKVRSEEHTSELQSHSFISYAVFCLKKKNTAC